MAVCPPQPNMSPAHVPITLCPKKIKSEPALPLTSIACSFSLSDLHSPACGWNRECVQQSLSLFVNLFWGEAFQTAFTCGGKISMLVKQFARLIVHGGVK